MNSNWLLDIVQSLNGRKTYLASAGFVVVALMQLFTHQYLGAFQSLMAALGAAGVRHAIAKHTEAVQLAKK